MAAKRFDWSISIRWLAWISLLVAFVLGQIAAKPDHQAMFDHYLPQLTLGEADYGSRGPTVFDVDATSPTAPDVVLLGEGEGYGGPMQVAILASKTDTGARIHDVVLMQNKETPPYVERLKKKHFFRQLANKPVTNDFLLDVDLDGYSGATVTANAISQAVRGAVHPGAVEHLGLTPTWQQDPWRLGVNELVMLMMVLAAIWISRKGTKRNKINNAIKVGLPFAALAFVGFYVNASVSIGSLSAILMGYIPTPKQYPLWWILMGGIAIGLLVMGRNVYCNKLCAFSTVQSLLSKISGLNLKLSPTFTKHSRTAIMAMIWASLMLIFLSRHPAIGSYEPFSLMFSLEGMGMQWYILPFSLIGSFFIPDFWCRYFCPVGLTLNEAVRLRRKAVSQAEKLIPVRVSSK